MMEYSVEVKEVWTHTIKVSLPANASRKDIIAMANTKLEEGDEEGIEYSHTLDSDTWNVRNESGKYL